MIELFKWRAWENPTTADSLGIEILRPLLPDNPDPKRYIRICEVYGEGKRTKAIEEILEFCDQDGSGRIIPASDTEFLWRNQSVTYTFSLSPLTDAEFLERLFGLVKSATKPDRIYQIYTNGQFAAIVRELVVEPEPEIPAWNMCHITGKPHRFLDPPYPMRFVWHSADGCNHARQCQDCHGLFMDYDK